MKICLRCDLSKEETEFYLKPKNLCKKCIVEKNKLWRNSNQEQYRKTAAKNNSKSKGRVTKRYSSYKNRAKTRNIEFCLTIEEFKEITDCTCKYCGNFTEKTNYSGIDRVNNDSGYLFHNCVSCCEKCNLMKRNYSVKVFLDHIKQIFIHTKDE